MIITVTLTPALDKTVVLPHFRVDEVNRVESLRLDAGGKGINVSKVLRALGSESLATGILGGGTGRYIEKSLLDAGVACDFVWAEQETRTNLKVFDPAERTNTDINEPGAPVSDEALEAVFEKIASRARAGDLVVLAGKAPAGTRDTIFAEWIARLKLQGAHVFLDADAALLIEGAKAGPALIKPNGAELARLMGRELSDIPDMADAACRLADTGIDTVVVSLGGEGALFVHDGEALRGRGIQVDAQSTVGAGDSMVAAMAHGFDKGLPFRETCRLALAVSAAAVTTSGTQPPDTDTVKALLPQAVLEEI
ncbi:MAG: 1-phosphofructokinase [Clostridia bacterium]|nr:1-phosphofructokinase [Clostridia bacterium]